MTDGIGRALGREVSYRSIGDGPPVLQIHGVGGARVTRAHELLAATAGIGYLISVASQTFNTANLFAGVAIFAVAGLILTELLQRAEAVLAPWRATT